MKTVLPNYLLIGVQKAATTWLAKCLGDHPDIYLSDPKELYFFNHRFQRGLAWYASFFERYSGQKAIGEATPGYISHHESAKRIRETLGNKVRFIVSLRHPVERAYSAFWMYMKNGSIPINTTFKEFYNGESRFGLRNRGFYYEGLRKYFELFPQKQFLVLIFEEFITKKKEALSKCYEFLGVNSDHQPAFMEKKENNSSDVKTHFRAITRIRKRIRYAAHMLPSNVRGKAISAGRGLFDRLISGTLPTAASYHPLDTVVRDELLVEYLDDIKRLEDLLQKDLSVWYQS